MSNFNNSRRDFLKTTGKLGVTLGALSYFGPLLTACSSTTNTTSSSNTSPDQKSSYKSLGNLTYQSMDIVNTANIEIGNGLKEAAAALGVGSAVISYDLDVNREISQMEQFSTQGGKMLLGFPFDTGMVPRVAKIAQTDKIYFSNYIISQPWFTPLNVGDYYVQYFANDAVQQGYEVAKALFKKIGGKGKVIHIPGYPGASADIDRTAGIKKALQEYPDIKLIVGQPGNWVRTDTRKSIEDLLVKVDSFDGAIGQNDDQAMGIVSVFKERKINVPIIGIDGNSEGIRGVKNGDLFATHTILCPFIGGWGAVQLFDAANGWKPTIGERMVYIPSVLVTKDNADLMLKKLGNDKNGKTEFDWKKMSRTYNPTSWDPQCVIKAMRPWDLWKDKPVAPGMGLPKEYEDAKAKGEFERVDQLYADHLKTRVI
jgi:ribose transport system substrate-binding protein